MPRSTPSRPIFSQTSTTHFFSLPTTVPPGPLAMNIGLIPKGSRAQNNSCSTLSHSAKANMPRSLVSASAPQWW